MSKEYFTWGKEVDYTKPYLFCHKCGAKYLKDTIDSMLDDPYYNATTEHYTKCYYCGNELDEERFTVDDEFDEELVAKRIKKDEKIDRHSNEKTQKRLESMGLADYQRPSKTTITCPYCKSENVKKISSLNRIVSVGTLGLAGSKIGKQWHCNNCKSDF
ncbi:MAG: hypothetical protein ACI4KG_08815 [Oscillospiraceae bacterium]